ncbi:hypothetical protein, partial [Pantoea ananatis]|uniref:hypothetical protein n=1 Tax=Pantoea ananas TaxID=553 RepID=UPI001B30DE82
MAQIVDVHGNPIKQRRCASRSRLTLSTCGAPSRSTRRAGWISASCRAFWKPQSAVTCGRSLT